MSDENDIEDKDVEASLDEPRSKKKILLLVVILAALAIGGSAFYFSGAYDKMFGGSDTEAAEEAGEASKKKRPMITDLNSGGGVFLAIPDMIVNLNTTDGSTRYLRLKVQLELLDPLDVAEVEAVMPKVIDQFQTYLRELRPDDMRGSKGLYRLQMELLARVNTAVKPVVVKDVLFQEILIQ